MSIKLSKTTIGPFELTAIESGRFRLDGGAMFGVVPKTLWSKKIPADEKNRIPMAMRCLLVESNQTGKIYLIDNGSGTKFNEKMEDIYAIDYQHSNLLSSLETAGIKPDDITDIIFSHLHFDHCGGTTYYQDKAIRHQFKNSAYHVNERHWKNATNPNEREKASFLKENIEPIAKSNRLNLVPDHYKFEKGLDVIPVNGHTIGLQLPRIQADGKTIVFVADLLPTYAHVPLPWIMGYDMYPVQTLKEKEEFLNEAAEKAWYLFLEHDSEHEIIQINKENDRFHIKVICTLNDID